MDIEAVQAISMLFAKIRVMQTIGHKCPYYRTPEECPICDVIREARTTRRYFPPIRRSTLHCILSGCAILGIHYHGSTDPINSSIQKSLDSLLSDEKTKDSKEE